MAYTLPTAADFKARFPTWVDVADATIDLYLADAPPNDSWAEGDYARAVCLWAAWAMTNAGIGPGAEIAGYVASGVNRLKSGSLDVSFSDGSSALTGYDTNVYGRDYAVLLRRNVGGPRVVRAARVEVSTWDC